MGRIKSTMIKKTAVQLLHGNESHFSMDFTHNKKVLKDTMPSKSIRNKVAGYIVRLQQQAAQPKTPRKVVSEPERESPQYTQ